MHDVPRAMHFVATLEEARNLIGERDRFWVSDCGCRQGAGKCGQSRMDVCLYFTPDFPPTGRGWHAAGRSEVEKILTEAREMRGGKLAVDRGRCYGCGLCVPSCPMDCVRMVERR